MNKAQAALSTDKNYGVDVAVADGDRSRVPERDGMDIGVRVGVIVGVGVAPKGLHPL